MSPVIFVVTLVLVALCILGITLFARRWPRRRIPILPAQHGWLWNSGSRPSTLV